MPNLLATIQSIAVNAVKSTNPITFVYGTVTNDSPLKIRIEQSTIQIQDDSIILTTPVIEKRLVIKKHNHSESKELADIVSAISPSGNVAFTLADIPPATSDSVTLNHEHSINDKILDGYVFEGPEDDDDHKFSVESNDEQIVITINRGLRKGDKVIMLRVSSGQQFIVLSRVFE